MITSESLKPGNSLKTKKLRRYLSELSRGTLVILLIASPPPILVVSSQNDWKADEAPKMRANTPTKFESGFSLPELLITLAVGLTLAATGILLASTATNEIRLSTSGTNYANLLQNARVRAVRDNVYYPVLVDCGTVGSAAPCAGPTPARAFIDINGNGTYDSGEP